MSRRELTAFVAGAAGALRARLGDERPYAVALYTSGEDDFSYVCFSANTEAALRRRGRATRWSVADWKYHDVAALDLAPGEGRARDRRLYESFVAALEALRWRGVVKVIACGDMSEEFFLRGLTRLNPKRVVAAYLREHTSTGFFADLARRPRAEQIATLLRLHRDLWLERPTREAAAARARNVTVWDIEGALATMPDAVDPLIDLVGELALARAPEAASVATQLVFVIEDLGRASDTQIARLQDILRRRVAIDRRLTRTEPIGENIARVLASLRPRRFPRPVLDGRTNHLRNPEAFLP